MKKKHFYCAVCGKECEQAKDKDGNIYKIRVCTKACEKEYWRKLHRQWQSEKTKKTGAWSVYDEQDKCVQ